MVRSIHDHREEAFGNFEGVATFGDCAEREYVEPPARLHLRELGRLHLGVFDGPAERSLIFSRTAPSTLHVTFVDGRPFLDLDLRSETPNAQHRCGDDVYDVTFFFRSADIIEETWRVRGPRKDYDASSVMIRVDHDDVMGGRDVAGLPSTSWVDA